MSTPVADWDDVALRDFGEIVAGGTPSRTNPSLWNGGIPWLTLSGVSALRGKFVRETAETISPEGLAGSAARLLPVGSIMVTTRATIGEVAIAGVPLATNQGFKNIVPNENTDSLFAYYAIQTINRQMLSLASGTTFLEISKADFSRIGTRRPKRDEQRRIAAVLDTVDDATAATEATIEKLRQVRQGLLHDLLTRGLDENGELRDPVAHPEQFKDSPFGLIPKEWEVERLDDIAASAVDGPFGSNLKTEHYVALPGVRVVRLQNIDTGRFNHTDKAYVSEEHARMLSRHQVMRGDLLVASMGDENHPFARACLYPDELSPGLVKADCFRLRMRSELAVNGYVMHFLNCPSTRHEVQTLGQGVTRDRVNLTTLLTLRVSRPHVEEQKEIVKQVDALDRVVAAEQQARASLMQLRSGLLLDLLSGRVRVPGIIGGAP